MTTRSPDPRPRRGMALVAVIGILVLLFAMTSGALHIALGDARRGSEARTSAIARAAADAGAWSLLRDWTTFDFDRMAVGDTLPSRWRAAGDGGVDVRGVRLSPLAWWITATGFAPDSLTPGHARHQVNLVLRQAIPELPVDAALTVRDSVSVTGRGAVVGSDTTTGAWGAGCTGGPPVAGIAIADTSRARHGQVIGAPPLSADPRAALPFTYAAFGPSTWASLVARASHVLPAGSVVTPRPSVTMGACDTADPANWGEPRGTGPCARHAPLVWVRGDLELRGGRGQGVLLVDGDVRLTMGAEFHGVLVTRDDLETGPGGGVVYGAALAADSVAGPGDHTLVGDDLLVRRSSCAVAGVMRRVAPLVPVARRPWAPMW